MEHFNMINASQDNNSDHHNITDDNCDFSQMFAFENFEKFGFAVQVVMYITISITLFLTIWAIFAVYRQVRNDHVAPIYIINLLISDVIQLCSIIIWEAPIQERMIFIILPYSYNFGVSASVCFMVCVAVERYLIVSCPLWYRFRRTIKSSVVVCVVVWVLPLVFLLTSRFWNYTGIFFAVSLLIPLPVFIFCLGGTLKALSASTVPSDEKRRILGILVLVLLIYTLLFLPRIISFLADKNIYNYKFHRLSLLFLKLSPLADLVLYVFMRKGAIDKLLAAVCCCRTDSNDTNKPAV
ncbi:G-protein coupled receptor 4-like [Chelmon rostratus]|uniref:G-protein coupled receptor 4-like n=1 Tax=Chelmon rostratus TaxID=109905 RepID=UPI001BEBEE05|nr:G-protein coupled receptor 4-like [Chelmon rostratus]